MKQFITRAYNSFQIDNELGTTTKISQNLKLKQEAKYILSLPESLKVLFPRIISFEELEETFKLKMELLGYRNLGEKMVYDSFDPDFWESISFKICKHIENFQQFKVLGKSKYLKQMFIDKTEKEYSNLINGFEFFKSLTQQDKLIIDGQECFNFEKNWLQIKPYIESHLIDSENFNIVHGDMCFSNILFGQYKDTPIIRYVDPRGSFGKEWIYGHSIYDFAKLAHSFDGGYEYFIFDQFKVVQEGKDLFNIIFSNDNKFKISEIFKNKIKNFNKVNIIQGLIFVGMCARHYDSLERQKAMYLTGIKLLNQSIRNIK